MVETAQLKQEMLYFVGLQCGDQPTVAKTQRKEIAMMEEELKVKDELMKKQERLVQEWRKELKDHSERHKTEPEIRKPHLTYKPHFKEPSSGSPKIEENMLTGGVVP
ncbi:hypothetical protein SADUNF_Sadunf02G0163100 [Salix dunnii]|uniref:Uncharacterized protein n=1 Tax=Salix dunnii TaxID=1413687 RepID=A0A835TIF8_9ROSI|nr:hypothetical protein SADUNF_Sadunf02G0163100 [Salix dunnii]